jgi:hypothetical protein
MCRKIGKGPTKTSLRSVTRRALTNCGQIRRRITEVMALTFKRDMVWVPQHRLCKATAPSHRVLD